MRVAELSRTEVRAGMVAAVSMIDVARSIAEETHGRFNVGLDPDIREQFALWVDGRDYVRIGERVAALLEENFVHASRDRRQGLLLALADLLCIIGDGCAVGTDWAPWESMEDAYRGQDAAKRRVRRAAAKGSRAVVMEGGAA